MRRKDLKLQLPDLPDEYVGMVLGVVNRQLNIGRNEGAEAVKSLLKDLIEVENEFMGQYVVTHEDSIDGG